MKLIGLGYIARSGKDTIADYLVNEHGFKKASYITSMKEALRSIFGFDDRQLYGDLKEVPDPFWDERLTLVENNSGVVCPVDRLDITQTLKDRLPITPRLIMQLMGTEAGRNVFGQNLWVDSCMRNLHKSGHDRWVIADVRFPNEADAILKEGGRVYQVNRSAAGATGGATAHPSEVALNNYQKWTGSIENNSSFGDLYRAVERLNLTGEN